MQHLKLFFSIRYKYINPTPVEKFYNLVEYFFHIGNMIVPHDSKKGMQEKNEFGKRSTLQKVITVILQLLPLLGLPFMGRLRLSNRIVSTTQLLSLAYFVIFLGGKIAHRYQRPNMIDGEDVEYQYDFTKLEEPNSPDFAWNSSFKSIFEPFESLPEAEADWETKKKDEIEKVVSKQTRKKDGEILVIIKLTCLCDEKISGYSALVLKYISNENRWDYKSGPNLIEKQRYKGSHDEWKERLEYLKNGTDIPDQDNAAKTWKLFDG